MKRWIEVEGKKINAVEFTRFIRQKIAPEINHMVQVIALNSNEKSSKLKRLQEPA